MKESQLNRILSSIFVATSFIVTSDFIGIICVLIAIVYAFLAIGSFKEEKEE